MNVANKNSYSKDVFSSLASASGEITVEVNGVQKKGPVSGAEIRPGDIAVNFDMNPGGPLNSLIAVLVKKEALNQKIQLPSPSVYFLYQDPPQEEWVAEKGWIRVEWVAGSKKVQGLFDGITSDRPESAKLNHGKFEFTVD